MLQKRVTVGATPGKTKHFQTLNIDPDLTLADCPGLVFPSFLASRAELVCNGVMPIDQMREYANYTAPIALMVRRVGVEQLREQYSLAFPTWGAGDEAGDEEYRRRAEEVLNAPRENEGVDEGPWEAGREPQCEGTAEGPIHWETAVLLPAT